MIPIARRLLLLLFWCLPALACSAPTTDPVTGAPELRRAFLEGVEALRGQRPGRYRKRLETLRLHGHPLALWLEEKALTRRLASLSDAEIHAFLARAGETPPGKRFRRRVLRHIARRGQWRRYLRHYVDTGSVSLRCHWLHARMATGRLGEDWYETAIRLWNVGHSQPDACDPVFERLYASGRITPTLLWERIGKAMDRGRITLARWLGKRLPAGQRPWVSRWVLAHRRPERALQSDWIRKDTPLSRRLSLHAVRRLARKDPLKAHRYLVQSALMHAFPESEYFGTLGQVALRAAREGLPAAFDWLGEIPADLRTRAQNEWRVRNALVREDWQDVLEAVESLPEPLRGQPEWTYWRARALMALGREALARPLLERLAQERNYHGFLAAETLGQPFRFNHRPIPATDTALAGLLADHPLLVAARDLYLIGWTEEARRAWTAGTGPLAPRELQLAAVLAHRLGWHDRAIHAAARSGHTDDLEIRFPLPHRSLVERHARRTGLDPTWIYGIMRQESAFMNDARSSAGALGLMQLMPATGRQLARQLRRSLPSRRTLLKPRENVHLGTSYLRRLLDEFGNQALASAAYNAGPQRVREWLRERGEEVDPRLLVDTLAFAETRGYVRAVLAFATVYRHRLGLRPIRIAWRLGLGEERLADRVDPQPLHSPDSSETIPASSKGSDPWRKALSASLAAAVSSVGTSPTGSAASAIGCASRVAALTATPSCGSTRRSP